jgi:hypothetical protein
MNVTDTASAAASKLITVQVSGSEKFSVKKDGVGYFAGNVGIGTSSPVSTLTLPNDGMISWASTACNIQATSSGADYIKFTTNSNEAVRITSTGSVGIGTTSPASGLDVNNSYVTITNNNSDWRIKFRRSDNTQLCGIKSDGFGAISFVKDTTEHMRITSGGLVGIGTSSPGAKFHVLTGTNSAIQQWGGAGTNFNLKLTSGDGSVSNSSVYRLALDYLSGTFTNGFIDFYRGGDGASGFLTFGSSGTERMRIDSSGNLLVGLTSGGEAGIIRASGSNVYGATVTADGGSAFNVNYTGTGTGYFGYYKYGGTLVGSISSTGTTTSYNTSSDARLKDNVADAEDAANLIDAIQVRKFDWKADGSHQRYGMIAQELVEVAPEAVSVPQDEDEMMGVDYSKLVPMLVKEIQSLRARVAQLEG